MNPKATHLNRRSVLRLLAGGLGAAAVGGHNLVAPRKARASADPKFLVVIPAFGGGAIIDSFLPIRESESSNPSTLDCFPDDQVVDIPSSPIRAADPRLRSIVGIEVDEYQVNLSDFAVKHRDEMMVTTLTGTSVNHAIAQHRALTGGGAWNGRTMQECVAMAYGEGFPLPNVNMSRMGYLEPGDDASVPNRVRAEPIAQPVTKPLSLSATRGVRPPNGVAPSDALIARARQLRNDNLDPESSFYQTFRGSDRLKRWLRQRDEAGPLIEEKNLIDKLFFVPEIEGVVPLSDYGLQAAPEVDQILSVFPEMFGENPDPLERQAALAYLLIKNQASVTVTLSPTFTTVVGGPFGLKTPPLAFDGSHQDHRAAQAIMWFRVLDIADRLIDLLKATPYDEDTGESFWDRTMIHIPTDFGRTKMRPAGTNVWGTGHHLSNGHLTISPLCNGNSVLGGVDPDTGLTYGFNLEDGSPDPGRNTTEGESFAGLLSAMGIDGSEAGLPDIPAMRR